MTAPKIIAACALLVIIPYVSSSQTNSTLEKPLHRRQLNIPGQEYTVRTNQGRQVIKIPSNARIKVIQAQPRLNRSNNPPKKYQRRPPNEDYDDNLSAQKPRKNRKKNYYIRDVSPQEFFEDDDVEGYKKSKRPYAYQNNNQYLNKRKRKGDNVASGSQRRPNFEEDSGYDLVRPVKRFRDHKKHFDENRNSEEFSASAMTMKQVPAPNLGDDGYDGKNWRDNVKKQRPEHEERYEDNYPQEPIIKKSPSTRHMQAMFPQQYTTHNPQVTQSFGLPLDTERTGNSLGHQIDDIEQNTFANFGPNRDYVDQVPMPSEVHPADLPEAGSGIHIVKPPQFSREGLSSTIPPVANQRATIRDILLQDCPDAEIYGYCASPPRYPTQQIASIIDRCSELIDAMYSPQPNDPEDDLTSFSSRSDDDVDIQFVENFNETAIVVADQPVAEPWSTLKRSGEGSNTICYSMLSPIEPGYAREVISGRWFVILQTLDSVVQRVMTDTCSKPGKSCTGLSGLKCSKSGGFSDFKSTRCIQRYMHQRLISWDPEIPQMCPKIRVFQFPSACLCHLSVD